MIWFQLKKLFTRYIRPILHADIGQIRVYNNALCEYNSVWCPLLINIYKFDIQVQWSISLYNNIIRDFFNLRVFVRTTLFYLTFPIAYSSRWFALILWVVLSKVARKRVNNNCVIRYKHFHKLQTIRLSINIIEKFHTNSWIKQSDISKLL